MARRTRRLGSFWLSRGGSLLLAAAVLAGLGWLAWPPPAPMGGLPQNAGDGLPTGSGPEVQRVAAEPSPQAEPAVAAAGRSDPDPLWRAVNEASLPALPPYGEDWSKEGRALVRMSADLEATRGLGVGDRLTLSVPQLGEVRSSAVEQVSPGAGARSLLGRAAWGDGRPRRWVVTVGHGSLFAWIDTPAGPHELAIRDGYGWLVPSASKMAGFDFSEPDYFIRGREGRPVQP